MQQAPTGSPSPVVSATRAGTLVRRGAWGVLLLVPLLLSLWKVESLPLYTKGEAREAVQVWAELHGGGWILPLRNGVEIPSKPPLFHWLAGAAALARGRVDEVAVRLPSLLMAGLAVLAIACVGARRWGFATGVAAGAVLATSFEWLRAARGARVDMTLAGCMTAALLCLERMVTPPVPSRAAMAGFYGAMALAVLAKGPVGYALPMVVLVAYLAVARDLARLPRLRPVVGSAIALGVPALWYAAAAVVGGEAFVAKQVLKENVFRFLGTGAMRGSHAHPFWYHAPAFLAGFLPWSFFLGPLIAWLVRERRRLAEDGRLFYVVWAVAIFVFYSIPSSKRSVYLLPAYPAVALLLARWGRDVARRRAPLHVAWRTLAAAAAVSVGIAGVALVAVATGGWMPSGAMPADWRFEGREALEGIASRWFVALGTAIATLAFGAVAARSLRAERWRAAFASWVLFASAASAFVIGAVEPGLAGGTTMRPIMDEVRRRVSPDTPLYFFGGNADYEVVFYADRRLPVLRRRDLDRVAATEPEARVLLFERRLRTLPPEIRARFDPIVASEKRRDERRGRLILASLAAGGRAEGPEPAPQVGSGPETPADPALFR